MKSNQCYFSSDPDEKTIPMAVEHLGEDRILYASDYPHWDSRFPHTVHELLKQEMASTAKAKILGGNAMQLFKLA
jgi:predicted TIM-barrel fold metal-dependent hydrolase